MKRTIIGAIVVVNTACSLIACGRSEKKSETITPKKVEEEVQEAAEAVASLTQQEMDDFTNQMESQLQTFDRKIDTMRSKSDALKGDAAAAMEEKMTVLEEKQAQARQRLVELKSAGSDAWDDVKRGLQDAMLRLNQALQEAAAEFS